MLFSPFVFAPYKEKLKVCYTNGVWRQDTHTSEPTWINLVISPESDHQIHGGCKLLFCVIDCTIVSLTFFNETSPGKCKNKQRHRIWGLILHKYNHVYLCHLQHIYDISWIATLKWNVMPCNTCWTMSITCFEIHPCEIFKKLKIINEWDVLGKVNTLKAFHFPMIWNLFYRIQHIYQKYSN